MGSSRLGPLVASVSAHVDGGPGDSDVPADDQARIRHQFLEAGYNGVLLRETRSPEIVADSLPDAGTLESNPSRHSGADRGISKVGSSESPAPGAGAAAEELLGQRRIAEGGSRYGLDHRGGSLEGPGVEPPNRGSGGAAGGENLGHEYSHCRDHRAPQTHQSGNRVSFSITEGTYQGASDSMGSAGLGAQYTWPGDSRLGPGPVLDRLCGIPHSGLSSSPRAGRPVEPGPLSTLVNAQAVSHSTALVRRSEAYSCKSFNLAEWTVADGPLGLSVALQCLLWPMWQDPGRQGSTPGLVKHLWKRIIQAPRAALHLRSDRFWMPLASRWCSVQAHPTALLRLMLSHFSSSQTSGEWGLHLPTFGLTPEATLRSNIMLLPLCVYAPSLTLQERVDVWATCIGRPILYGCADTVHLSLEDICIRVQGCRDASWPFIRPHPQLTDSRFRG